MWFVELYSGEPITYQEIKAWSQLTRTRIDPWEVSAIKRIELEKLKQRDG